MDLFNSENYDTSYIEGVIKPLKVKVMLNACFWIFEVLDHHELVPEEGKTVDMISYVTVLWKTTSWCLHDDNCCYIEPQPLNLTPKKIYHGSTAIFSIISLQNLFSVDQNPETKFVKKAEGIPK